MTKSYEVDNKGLADLLGKDEFVFSIPIFQRRYTWGQDEVNELVNDIFYGGTWLASSVSEPYFLGSLVFSHAEDGSLQVLDGQQRLTTLSLMISVLQDLLEIEGSEEAPKLRRFLWAERIRQPSQLKMKLQSDDKDVFSILVSKPSRWEEAEIKKTPLGIATHILYEGLTNVLNAYVAQGKSRIEVLEVMAARLTENLEFVAIESRSDKDAFRLFETLNDRGLALNAADLIKNKVLSRSPSNIHEIFDAWNTIVETVNEKEIINFLRYYWISEYGFIRKEELYDNYKEKINGMNPVQISELVSSLKERAGFFAEIIEPKPETNQWGSSAGESLLRISRFGAKSLRGALLACAKYRSHDMEQLARYSESLIFRFSLVGDRNPNQLEIRFAKAAKDIREGQLEMSEIVKELFESLAVPSDDETKELLQNKQIYSPGVRWREVLVRINKEFSTGEISGRRKVHIEHILPQEPTEEALREAEMDEETAQEYNCRLGNFTLLDGRKNQQVSNREYSFKQGTYLTSEIAITNQLEKYKTWKKADIENRTREFVDSCLRHWPAPNNT